MRCAAPPLEGLAIAILALLVLGAVAALVLARLRAEPRAAVTELARKRESSVSQKPVRKRESKAWAARARGRHSRSLAFYFS